MKIHRAFLPLLLATAACSSNASTTFGGSPPDAASTQLVVKIGYEGGFVPVEYNLTSLPLVSVYADGTVLVQGPQIEIYPPPAMIPLNARTVTPAGLDKIRRAAEDAGLTGPNRRYDYPLVADASDSVFTYLEADGTRHEIRAYALDITGEAGGPGTNLSAEDTKARRALAEFQTKMTDLASWLGSDVSQERSYDPRALRVFVREYQAVDDPAVRDQQPREWPLPDQPLTSFGTATSVEGYRCGTLQDQAAATLQAELRQANTLTPWTSAGGTFSLSVRPLLPDESGCPTP